MWHRNYQIGVAGAIFDETVGTIKNTGQKNKMKKNECAEKFKVF